MSNLENMKFQFSFWVAQRAIQSARLKGIFNSLSEKSNKTFDEKLKNIDIKDYKKWHNETCSILNNDIPFGVKAKFIAIFVKSYYVLGNYKIYKNIAFPPIDSRTIETLNTKIKVKNLNLTTYKWSKLNQKDYYYLLNLIENNYSFIYQIEEDWKDRILY
jgi:hypothetical protein